jgi:3-oxoacyl-[acyl-carrier-protein] synthase II
MSASGERILVTGLGVVSPLGNSTTEYWEGLLHRPIAPQPLAQLSASAHPSRIFYSAALPSAETVADRSRANAFARAAARQALDDAALVEPASRRGAIGVAAGTALGSHDVLEAARAEGREIESEQQLFFDMGERLAATFALDGPNVCVSTACAAGLYSVGIARDVILSGEADVMLVGGCDVASRVALACFHRLQALDPERCSPFNAGRRGTVGGEGAAFAVLESERHWVSRGRPQAHAVLLADAWSCDGTHITAPDREGTQVEIAMRRALTEARLDASEVDCVVAHGTGTRLNDDVESKVVARVFGEAPNGPWVVAPKSKLGHSGGAAGAFGFVTGVLIAQHEVIPPAYNLDPTDPACAVRFNRGAPVAYPIRAVMVNSYGFGGNNISVLLGPARNA